MRAVKENKMQRFYCVIHLFMSFSIHVRQIGQGENFIFQIQDDGHVGVDGVDNVDGICRWIVHYKF